MERENVFTEFFPQSKQLIVNIIDCNSILVNFTRERTDRLIKINTNNSEFFKIVDFNINISISSSKNNLTQITQ